MVRRVIKRGEEELNRIKTAGDVKTLIDIMKESPDSINHESLMNRLVEEKAQSVPLVLRELKEPQYDSFVEIAVRTIHRTGINCAARL